MAPVRGSTDSTASDEGHLVQHGGYYMKGVKPDDVQWNYKKVLFNSKSTVMDQWEELSDVTILKKENTL